MQPVVDYDQACIKDKEYFKSIPKKERSAWNTKMLQTPQEQGKWKEFKTPYPESGKWNYKGDDLYYAFGRPERPAKALVFFFHGMNAHGESSGYMTMDLVNNLPVDAYALDFRNFGRSGGDFRGEIASFDSLIEQSEGFIEFIKQQYQDAQQLKVFIGGLSLGGTICFKLCLRNPSAYSGVIFLSPAIRENKEAQPYLKMFGKAFGALFPRAKLIAQSFNSQSRVDQTERLLKDKYIYNDKIVPGSVRVVLNTMASIETQYSEFSNPYILIQSGVDKLVDPFAALDLEEQSKSPDQTVIYYRKMWHAVFGEEEIEHIVPVVRQWLGKRL